MSEQIDIVVQPWYIKHGKQILIVIAILALAFLVWRGIYNSGRAASDKAWLELYNRTVKEYNQRLELISKESADRAAKLLIAEKKIADGVNTAADKVKEESESETANGDRGADCQITVNSKMPKSVLDAWTEMNKAAAAQIQGAK